jgi:SpoIIAA-like
MIRILSGFPENVVAVACEGRVTRKDYDDILVPTVTAALQRHEKVRLYYEITPQFSGMEAGAIWEDFRVGMEHLLRWERIAVVTDIAWIRHTVNAFRFLLPGKVRLFAGGEAGAAREWIAVSEA